MISINVLQYRKIYIALSIVQYEEIIKVLNSLKAISLGVITLLILGLVNQLLLIMATVGYNSLIKLSSVFIPWLQLFTYSLGAVGYFIVMTSTGLVTAMVSQRQPCIHAIIAALAGSCISLYLSLREDIFTLLALLFIILGIGFAVIGCWLWKKYQQKKR